MITNMKRLIVAFFVIAFTLPAMAATVTNLGFAGGCPADENDPQCDNSGNPDNSSVSLVAGTELWQISKGDEADGSLTSWNDKFSITFDSGTSGSWSISDTSISHLAFKADGYFILASVDAGQTSGSWSSDGADWSVSGTCPEGICNPDARPYVTADFQQNGSGADLSNVTAYSAVPVPAAVWLFGSALAGLGFAKRRKVA
jgi:hypothetical protein